MSHTSDQTPGLAGAKALINFEMIREAIRSRFSLKDDRADHAEIDVELRAGVSMRGTNLWVLMFAILIASIGLNVNSTAVIIGAMLISPLMGPIIGVGYGAGIFDFALVKRALVNLGVATVIALLTSTTYFFISPLTAAQSELLARTNPTIWDVLIAFFGGLAGIVAATRKHKTNVIPGVAIATALMPPLCTAGYGLATRSWGYFFGAFYLFTINCVFIAGASVFVTRAFHLSRKRFVNEATEKRVTFAMWAAMLVTLLPSTYLAYQMVGYEVFRTRASQFVGEQFTFPRTHVTDLIVEPKERRINVTLLGDVLNKDVVATIVSRLPRAGLAGAQLNVIQADEKEVDFASLRTTLLGDLYRDSQAALSKKDEQLAAALAKLAELQSERERLDPVPAELHALFPTVDAVYVGDASVWRATDEASTTEGELIVVIQTKQTISQSDREQLERWLVTRTGRPKLRVLFERV